MQNTKYGGKLMLCIVVAASCSVDETFVFSSVREASHSYWEDEWS